MGERTRADEPSPEFRILGPLEAVAGARPLDLGSPKQRDLLAILLINAGRVVSTAQLADDLWSGEPPDRPEPTLQAYVSRLRKVLGAERLVTRAPGYMLDVRPDDVDAMRFERLLTSGRDARNDGEPDRARALLHEALALWRGRALDGVRFLAAEQEAARLEALRMECVEERIDSDLALGAGAELVAELQALNAADPLRERIAGQLATALYRAGRQSDALDVLQRVAHELREQLGVDPSPALRALEESILRQEPALEHRPTVYVRTEVGAEPRAFIGRSDELTAVAAQLEEPGLVTLTGLGGTGKTRLALAVADMRPDVEGVVRLAPLRDGELIFRAIASALGIGEVPGRRVEDLVTERLATSSGVLVIDNCEHLVADVSAVVFAMRVACPDLRILATSREPMGVSRERVWPVPPMQPQDATKLFAERATAANPDVSLPFDAVERVCARVGGIPLAVELAAARTRVLSVEQIAERLGDVVRTIDPDERLASALSWAVEELGPLEQLLLERLSVFAGSITLDDAEAVCPDDALAVADVLPAAARLVEMSLLTTESDGDRMRYRLLEPVRQFAARRFDDPTALAARHLAWAISVARTDDDDMVFHVLDDLRAALRWAVTEGNDTSTGLELACTVAGYWRVHGHWDEGLRWLGEAIKAAPNDDDHLRIGHRKICELAHQAGRASEAIAHGRTAIAMAEAAGDDHTLAWTTMALGVALSYEDAEAARPLYERALVLAGRIGDEILQMQTLHNLAVQEHEDGNNPAARGHFEQALAIALRREDTEAIVITKQCLARLAIDRRELDEARRLADESVGLARRARVTRGIDHGLFLLGYIAMNSSDFVRAHAYYEEMVELARTLGNPMMEVQSLLCLAGALSRREMHAEAMRVTLEARDVAAPLESPRLTREVNLTLAGQYLDGDDVERAALYVDEAMAGTDVVGRVDWLMSASVAARVLARGGAYEDAVALVGTCDALLVADERPGAEEWDERLGWLVADARERLGPRFDECWTLGATRSDTEAALEARAAVARTFALSPKT